MRNVAWQVTWTIATVCLAAGAQSQTAQVVETYRISGVMVNSVTGKLLSQASVHIKPDDGSSKGMEVTTGSDGRFVFEHLSAGSWTLSAERRGFLGQNYGQHSAYSSAAISVVTGPAGVSENLVFGLNPPAAIRGKVIDENGEPVMSAHVEVLVKLPGARSDFRVVKTVPTDDIGEYRVPDLPAVACYLFTIVPVPADGGGFTPQYYPNISDPHAATPIRLKPGEDFTADFTLHRGRGVSIEIEGPSDVPGGSDSELLLLLAEGPQGSEVSVATLGPGSGRTFHNVVPGRYKLAIADLKSTYATTKWIQVGSEDMTVKLPFPDPPEVTAKVRVVDGDSSLLRKALLGITSLGKAGSNFRPLTPDGIAVFPGMASDRYSVVLASTELYVKSVTARNAGVVDGLVDLPESGPVRLEIVAGGDGSRVKGRVRAGGKPVSGVLVVLAPSRQSVNSDDYHGYQSDSDGTFDFRGIKPGDYTLFATGDWQLEYGNRAAIGKYLAAGKPVKAEPKATVEVELELSSR